MGGLNSREAYELDAETYGDKGGGLLGMLLRFMQQQGRQRRADLGSSSDGGPEYNADSHARPPGGLIDRLRALQLEQNQYQPILGNNATPQADTSAPPLVIQQTEADQAQQAREAAAARLVRGVRSLTRAEAPPPDPVDIAKSAGIGLANGAVNTLALPGDLLTGFGYLPNNLVINRVRRMTGHSDLPADAPDWIRDRITAEPIQHWVERNTFGEFYRPKTKAGRFAATIGEMAPMVVVGEAVAARLGAKTARAALRELPGTLAKHAVAPGVAVQTLEEALPDSNAGPVLQKAYPVLRRSLPAVLAAKRYLSRRVVPQ